MKKIVAVLLLALLVTCCVLPVTTQAVTVRREFAEIINVDNWCNMRARPTVESEIVARVNRGDRVMLLCKHKHFVRKQETYDKCKAEREDNLRILLPSSEICKCSKQNLS